ncbi:phenylalanine--tRNA ligase alpha subunit, cytoplasmic-like isoform X2 [Musa acuminata AAA Group]|uniref:phenylalanine--tRNA ligase alpha subunit, cytoplasmic-like isoform X2 n=1 Tax=Musa acuminata AAA Group TaxID=214697 RepID=UPI0031DD42ED
MGFEEMPTNNFVESSFWNFDALFQPQQHPAHDSHADPASRRYLPEDYVERVKLVLESGGYGSKGYGNDWKGKKLIRISFGHTQLQFLLEYITCLLSRANRWKMEPHS